MESDIKWEEGPKWDSSEAGTGKDNACPLEEVTAPDNLLLQSYIEKKNEDSIPIYETSNFYYKQPCIQNTS